MNYEQTLRSIHSMNRFGIKPGLQRITALLNALKNPQDRLQFVHVAGTNGKGSVSTMLSEIFMASGKKTGLFISPYVVDFRERIQINRCFIDKQSLCDCFEITHLAAQDVTKALGEDITEFEFITAVAMLYFERQHCDIVVLETGLGGRLDSTNVIRAPLACVITKIAYDHMAVLGDTIGQIATEKSGIIKPGTVVVTPDSQQPEALSVITDTAHKMGCQVWLAELSKAQAVNATPFGTEFTYHGLAVHTNLPGRHQIENTLLVIEAARALGVDDAAILAGIAGTRFPARLEVLSRQPLVVLDGAHNANGAEALCGYIRQFSLRPVAIIGMMADKNCAAVLSQIAPLCQSIITVTVQGNPRAEQAGRLAEYAAEYCADVTAVADYPTAIRLSKAKAGQSMPLFICGSLYLAADIRQLALDDLKK